MKKFLALILIAVLTLGLAACTAAPSTPAQTPSDTTTTTPSDTSGDLIRVGIVNNPPSESGYRAANVADFERVFNEANGYKVSTFYSLKNDEQLNAAQQFITDGVDYLLISAAATDGWTNVLENAKNAGVKVFLFDRMMNVDESLFEAAVISDMKAQGKMAVQWLLDQSLSEYCVVHIQGAMGSDAQIGRTEPLNEQFEKGTMKLVTQQTATWDEATAKQIVESVINSGEKFNVIYAENDGMARGAVAALDEAGITHGANGDVIVIGFDFNKWALREVLAGNWNLDVQCSPFQAEKIHEMIQDLEAGKTLSEKIVINEERYFDAATITEADIDKYGIGD